VGGISPTDGA